MPVTAICPACNTNYNLDNIQAGKRVCCPVCKGWFDVPSVAATPVVPEEAPPAAPGVKVVQELIPLHADKKPDEAGTTPAPTLTPRETVIIAEQATPTTPPVVHPRNAIIPSLPPTPVAPAATPVALVHEEPRPLRRRRWHEEEEERSGAPVVLIVGLLVGGVCLLAAFVILLIWLLTPSPVDLVVQDNGPPVVIQPPANPPPFNPPPFNPPVFQPPIQPEQPLKPAAGPWRPAVDAAVPPKLKVAVGDPAVAVFAGGEALFPTRLSAFVAVHGGAIVPVFDVWNLESMRAISRFDIEPGVGAPYALSADGRRLAGRAGAGVKVMSVGIDPVRTLKPADGNLDWFDFADPDHLVSLRHDGAQRIAQVWDLKTGRPTLALWSPGGFEARGVALSPSGKYLAIFDKGKIAVEELANGIAAVQTLVLPKQRGAFPIGCLNLAYSDDGRQLGGLFNEPFTGWRILCWELQGGKLVVDHPLPENLGKDVRGAFFYKGPPLEWLPDNSGWMLYGQARVDYKTGRTVGTLPPRSDLNPDRCRVLTPDLAARVISLDGLRGAELRIVALPKR
jgi:hypothetical protein